jgi:hypothetical protein
MSVVGEACPPLRCGEGKPRLARNVMVIRSMKAGRRNHCFAQSFADKMGTALTFDARIEHDKGRIDVTRSSSVA